MIDHTELFCRYTLCSQFQGRDRVSKPSAIYRWSAGGRWSSSGPKWSSRKWTLLYLCTSAKTVGNNVTLQTSASNMTTAMCTGVLQGLVFGLEIGQTAAKSTLYEAPLIYIWAKFPTHTPVSGLWTCKCSGTGAVTNCSAYLRQRMKESRKQNQHKHLFSDAGKIRGEKVIQVKKTNKQTKTTQHFCWDTCSYIKMLEVSSSYGHAVPFHFYSCAVLLKAEFKIWRHLLFAHNSIWAGCKFAEVCYNDANSVEVHWQLSCSWIWWQNLTYLHLWTGRLPVQIGTSNLTVKIQPIASPLLTCRESAFNKEVVYRGIITGVCMASFHSISNFSFL